ncbi:MAG: glycosyltransferase [Mariniphaga sp.]
MKILFITDKDVSLTFSGAQVMTNRNYLSLIEIFGKENIDVLQLEFLFYKNRFIKLINLLKGYNDFLNPKIVKNITEGSDKFDHIILDFSTWGIISKKLKLKGYKGNIHCFFHNVEFSFHWQERRFSSIINLIKLYGIYINEKLSCKYSDTIIALNIRDAKNINKYYGRKPDAIIPISFVDRYNNSNKNLEKINPPYNLLFIGSYFWANVKGIKWFMDQVLPYIENVKLTVAGNGMNQLREVINIDNIVLYDKVRDLKLLIENADFLVLPIFDGSGMKVKTAEGLMYGKNIIGTTEAFMGYDLNYQKVGALCNTKEEFIDFFNSTSLKNYNRFNEYSRNQFKSKYSFDATLVQFSEIFELRKTKIIK